MASRPFQFLEKNAPKSERERPSTLRDWPPCPPIQRDGGWRSRPGVNPFISALTVARCLADFPGVWPQLRDILSTSRSVGRGTGAFIYALSADETRPALAAPRHASTALFSCRFKSCRFKCPCPPRRQRHFHDNADRAYNTLHFASKVVCQRALLSPVGSVKRFKMQRILRSPLATRAPLDSPFTLSYGRCDFIVVALRFIPVSSRFAECHCNPKEAVL